MHTYTELKTILDWEYRFQLYVGERDEVEGYDIDIDATARNAWKAMANSGLLKRLKNMPEEWERFESLHISALEYMEEPYLVLEREN